MKEIANLLNLPKLERVEAYDISNISGFQTVGSMVVFEKAGIKGLITENQDSRRAGCG